MIACLLGSWRSDLFDLAGGNCCYCCCSVHTVADTCSSTGRPFASPQRGPCAPSPRTGGASEWTYADPFAAKVQAWGGFGLEPEGSWLSEAWDTGAEDVSCADGLPSVDCHTVPGTAAGVVQLAASVVAEILRVAEAEGRLSHVRLHVGRHPAILQVILLTAYYPLDSARVVAGVLHPHGHARYKNIQYC